MDVKEVHFWGFWLFQIFLPLNYENTLHPLNHEYNQLREKMEFFTQVHKWYQSWWIDLAFDRELSMIHNQTSLNVPNLKKKCVRDKE